MSKFWFIFVVVSLFIVWVMWLFLNFCVSIFVGVIFDRGLIFIGVGVSFLMATSCSGFECVIFNVNFIWFLFWWWWMIYCFLFGSVIWWLLSVFKMWFKSFVSLMFFFFVSARIFCLEIYWFCWLFRVSMYVLVVMLSFVWFYFDVVFGVWCEFWLCEF